MSPGEGPYRQSSPPPPLPPGLGARRAYLDRLRGLRRLGIFVCVWSICGPIGSAIGTLLLAGSLGPASFFEWTLIAEAVPLLIYLIVAFGPAGHGVPWRRLLWPITFGGTVAALECWFAWGLTHFDLQWHGN